jgi:hypothetical protein
LTLLPLKDVPEIAAVLPGDEESFETNKRDIIIESRDNKLKSINQFNARTIHCIITFY